VDQRRRLTSSAVIIAAITTVVSLPGPVLAADAAEVESLRREVRQLQADLQVLRTAVAEATELERLRSTNLARQMRDPHKAAEAQPAPPPIATAEAPSASREASAVMSPTAAEDRPARAKHRRNRHTSRGRAKAGKVQAR
jgi:hypothetical protein